jgi:hypothetical protein
MEQVLTRRRPRGGEGATIVGKGIDEIRTDLDGILAEADRILDGLGPINAEEYLQQNRQDGGQ